MRWIIFYLRSCFCNHKWELEEKRMQVWDKYTSTTRPIKDYILVSATCEKCGWHRSYNKF